jgi:hypothetical protein
MELKERLFIVTLPVTKPQTSDTLSMHTTRCCGRLMSKNKMRGSKE